MNRTVALVVVSGLIAANGFAAPLPQGTREIGVRGNVDFASAAGTSIDGEVALGIFALDNFEVGLTGSISKNDVLERWSGGVFSELNIDMGGALVPFIGVAAEFASAEIEADGNGEEAEGSGEEVAEVDDDSEEAVILTAKAGLKWFVASNIAIDTAIAQSWATEDVFQNDNKMEDTDTRVEVGIRVFF